MDCAHRIVDRLVAALYDFAARIHAFGDVGRSADLVCGVSDAMVERCDALREAQIQVRIGDRAAAESVSPCGRYAHQ
jgi:hypothetical protein